MEWHTGHYYCRVWSVIFSLLPLYKILPGLIIDISELHCRIRYYQVLQSLVWMQLLHKILPGLTICQSEFYWWIKNWSVLHTLQVLHKTLPGITIHLSELYHVIYFFNICWFICALFVLYLHLFTLCYGTYASCEQC